MIESDFTINTTEEAIYQIVKDSLVNESPLYHLRCGDGEMIMIAAMSIEDRPIYERFSISQFGYIVPPDLRLKIKINLETAIQQADIIGLPELHHRKRSKWWDQIIETYTKLFNDHAINIETRKFCSINSHHSLLDSGFLDKIIMETDQVVLITSRDIREGFLKKFNHVKNLELHLIPAEQQYETKPSALKFFPEIYEEVKKKIESKNRKGQLCLYGTGVAGKDLGLFFKNSGGIAIDIGSVFDSWYGKNTRGPGKSPISESLKNKL